MKKYVICSIFCIAFCFMTSGCRSQVDIDAEEAIHGQESVDEQVSDDQETEKEDIVEETVQSSEEGSGEYHFVLPEGWTVCENKQSQQSVLELQGGTDDQYAAVIVLDKNDIIKKEITAYIDRYAQEAGNTYEDAVVGQPELFPVKDYTAYKLLIQGTLEEKEYTNLVYAVDSDNCWYITTACAYLSSKTVLEQAMDGFVQSFYKAEEVASENSIVE